MKEIGLMTITMAKELKSFQMEINMKENLFITKYKAKEFAVSQMEINMKEIFSKDHNMAKDV